MSSCIAQSRTATSAANLSRKRRQHTIKKLPGNRVEVNGFEFNLNEPPELHEFRAEGVAAIRQFMYKLQGPLFAYLVVADMYGMDTTASWEHLEAASIAFAPKYKMPMTSVSSLKRHTPEIEELEIVRTWLIDYERSRLTRREDFWNAHPGHTQIHQFEFNEIMLHKQAEIAAAEHEHELAVRKARRTELEHARYERRKATKGIPHESEPVTERVTDLVTEPRVLNSDNPCGDNRSFGATSSSCAGAHLDDEEAKAPKTQTPKADIGHQGTGDQAKGISDPEYRNAVVQVFAEAGLLWPMYTGRLPRNAVRLLRQVYPDPVDIPAKEILLALVDRPDDPTTGNHAAFISKQLGSATEQDLASMIACGAKRLAKEAAQDQVRDLAAAQEAEKARKEAKEARNYEQQLQTLRDEFLAVYEDPDEFDDRFSFWEPAFRCSPRRLLHQLRADLEKEKARAAA